MNEPAPGFGNEARPRLELTWNQCRERAEEVADQISAIPNISLTVVRIYPIPRGGVYAGLMVADALDSGHQIATDLVETPDEANVFIDDIIDTGNTRLRYQRQFAERSFFALADKLDTEDAGYGWVSFPWERMTNEAGPEENVRRVLEYVGEDPDRPGLKETPARVVRAYDELFAGYKQNPDDLFKVFDGVPCDEMIVLRDIPFVSTCEHHMMQFTGVAHVGYVPDGDRVIGLSKLARLVDVFAYRLQLQEQLATQIAEALWKGLNPKGAACAIEASHSCMSCRGVKKTGAVMVTSKLLGVFKEPTPRDEFLSLIGLRR